MSRAQIALGFVFVAGGLAVQHLLQTLVGHERFALVGPVAAAAMAAGVWCGALRGRVRAPTGATLVTALFTLLLVPEWAEGEISLGHEFDPLGHALPATVSVVTAAVVVAAIEARRTFALLRDAFG